MSNNAKYSLLLILQRLFWGVGNPVMKIAMFTMPTEAWAQADGQAQPQGEQAGGKLTFVASPNDEAGELVFDDQTKRLTVTPKEGYYLDRVVFTYTEQGGPVN